MNKKFTFYILILLFFGSMIWFTFDQGSSLKNPQTKGNNTLVAQNSNHPTQSITTTTDDNFGNLLQSFKENFSNPIGILLLQVLVIIIFARLFGFFFGKIRQPTVIGEIIAGILLGPSVLGLLLPDVSAFIFPVESLKNLEILSNVGLVLFMFIIGMELDVKVLKTKVQSALVISHTSIVIAFFMGICLSYLIFERFAPAGVTFTEFSLFIGIAMSIAAFPVLARIVQEKGLTKTSFGKMIITIAAIDDITAWCILAIVVAVIQAGNATSAFISIAFALVYVSMMLFVAQPLMRRLGSIYISKEILNKNIVAFVFFILFLSAYLTEIIGIKALFGGFMAGVIMPSNHSFKKIMTEKIEDFSLVILIPLFFAFTGLRTHIGLINEGDLWLICGMIILFAIVGKFGGSLLAAKITGQNWKNSFMIGTLMNTRGLMELIVLNIGFDLGILSSQVFTMMVIMTLVTTFMTGPVLSLIEWLNNKRTSALIELSERGMNVLISFGIPQTGGILLRVLNYFIGDNIEEKNVSALHLTPFTDISRADALKYEKRSFTKIRSVANELSYKLNPIYKTTNDVTKEILRTLKSENSNLLLMGAAKSIFVKNVLGGKVRNIMDQATCNVGVFIDNEFRNADNILLFIDSRNFKNMLELGLLLLYHSSSKLTFVDEEQIKITQTESFDKFLLSANDVTRIDMIKNVSLDNQFLEKYGLIIMDVNRCEQTILQQPTILESNPSILIFEFKHTFLKNN